MKAITRAKTWSRALTASAALAAALAVSSPLQAAGPLNSIGDVIVRGEEDFAKSWSNNANDGRFDNPQNWTDGTLPASGEDVAVIVSDDTVISSETAMTVGTVSVPSGTVRFSGSGAAITLGGLNLSEGSTVEITGREGLSDGSIKGVGTLVVNPGADNTYTMPQNNGGNAVPFDAAYFWGETVIKSGTVKAGNIWSFGSRRDNDDNRQIPTVRVKGGATLDENGLSSSDYNGETLRVILEEGTTLKSTGNSSSGLTSLFLEGNATVDTSSGKVVACYGYDCGYYPVWVNLGTNTLTKVGTGQFYLSACEFTGTGTFDVQQGEVRVKIDGWNWYPTSTLEDGTLRIRSGATFTLENRGDNSTHFTAKDLVLDGTIARTAAGCVFTVTGTVTGSGTAAALALAQGAVFKPSGTGYLTITDSLSGVFELDMSGVDLSGAQDIPLVSVPSALADGVSFAPATIPEGWSVLRVPENGNVRYLLIEGFAVDMPSSPTPTAFSVGQQTAVTLTCATEGATIYYTTDGSDPTTSSTAYSAPFAVTDGTTVKARAYKTGCRDSLIYIATFTYVPPATLTHRWSFNGRTDEENLRDSIDTSITATKYTTLVSWDGTNLVMRGNGTEGSKGISLGHNLIDTSAATLEIWATEREVRNWNAIFEYAVDTSNNVRWRFNRGTNNSRQSIGAPGISVEEYFRHTLDEPAHFSVTFSTVDGRTTVRWMRRNAKTGAIEYVYSGTMSNALADFVDPQLIIGGSMWDDKTANADFDEVRVWKGVLSDDQLTASVLAGPDTPLGGGTGGVEIPANVTFSIPTTGGYGFKTDQPVGIGEGAKIRFDTTGYFGKGLRFKTGGIAVPSGVVLDYVELSDTVNYAAMMEDADTILVRLKDAVPYTSTWIGSVPSTAADLSNPANWASTNAIGAAVSAAPTLVTTVIIPADKLGSFSLPADASVNWGRIFFGGQATATHYGFKDGSPDSLHNAWRNLALTSYSNVGTVPDDSNDISYLTATQDTPGTPAELSTAQIRLEGWFYVTAAQAGRWSMPSYFDDVLSFAIDGEWVLLNSTYLFTNGAGAYVSEGWHRFTLAAADTGGGWGSRYKFAEGVFVPFVVSINGGANIQFSSDNFTFGSGEVTVTLSDDLDWRALGKPMVSNAVTIDLNGHNLIINDMDTDVFGAKIVNTAETPSTIYVTVDPANARIVASGLASGVPVVRYGSSTATWTGAAGDGDAVNPANWIVRGGGGNVIEGVAPDSSMPVTITGTNVNMTNNVDKLRCASFTIGACTFTADCDWRGLSVKPAIVGTADLNGHTLKLASLQAILGGALVNSADGISEVQFVATGNATEADFIEDCANLRTAANARIAIIAPAEGFNTDGDLDVGNNGLHVAFVQTEGSITVVNTKFGGYQSEGIPGYGYYVMRGGWFSADEIAASGWGNGEFLQTGGDVVANIWFNVGRYGGHGVYKMTGGTLTANSDGGSNHFALLGATGGTGVLDIGGDAVARFNGAGHYLSCGSSFGGGSNHGEIYVRDNASLTVEGAYGGRAIALGTNAGDRSGKMVQTGGTINTPNHRISVGCGSTGEYTISGGTASCSEVLVAESSGVTGTLTMNGGTIVANSITGGSGNSTVIANGGTFKVAGDNVEVFPGVKNVTYGAGGLTIDTDGHTATLLGNQNVTVLEGSTFVKDGAGTLTVQELPPVDTLEVKAGTLALQSIADSSHPRLTHRWSFNGTTENEYLSDSVGHAPNATKFGTALSFDGSTVNMTGDGEGVGSLNLGSNLIPSGDVTFEFWAKNNAIRHWGPVFEYGTGTADELMLAWTWRTDASWSELYIYYNGSETHLDMQNMFNKSGMLHIVARVAKQESGLYQIDVIRRNLDAPSAAADVRTFTAPSGWTPARIASGSFYLGRSFWGGDKDANATYDEVRIWNCALSDDAIACSFAKGPNASSADLEEITADIEVPPAAEEPSEKGAVVVAPGALLDIDGGTFEREYVSGGGTVINGTLTASKELRAKLGDCLTISSGATFNIDGAKAAFSAEDIASLRTKRKTYTLVKVANGGTIEGSLLQPASDAQLPTGWHVIQTPGSVTLRKNGVTIHIR